MQQNINKVVERGEALESLQDKTDQLQDGALQFKRGANRVRKEYMLQKPVSNLLECGGKT